MIFRLSVCVFCRIFIQFTSGLSACLEYGDKPFTDCSRGTTAYTYLNLAKEEDSGEDILKLYAGKQWLQ